MNRIWVSRLVLLTVAAALFGAQALAGQGRHVVDIRYDAVIDGQKIEKGAYQVEVTTDPDATLILLQDNKEVARVRVEKHDLTTPAQYDEVRFRKGDDGERQILQLTFKGSQDTFRVKNVPGVATAVNP